MRACRRTLYRSPIDEHHDPRKRASPLFNCFVSEERRKEGSIWDASRRQGRGKRSSWLRPSLIVARRRRWLIRPFFSRPSVLPPNYAVHSETVRLQAAPLQLHRLRIAVRGSGVLATNHHPKDSRELNSGNLLILLSSSLPDCHLACRQKRRSRTTSTWSAATGCSAPRCSPHSSSTGKESNDATLICPD